MSDLNSLIFPLSAISLRTALMNDELVILSITSICIALVVRHVNIIAHLLLKARPPLVLLDVISQGPKVSTPTEVKGGPGVKRSHGRSAIF